MRHWIPFDQATLERALGLSGRQLEAYLFNDHHTLAELARRRGVHLGELADHLVAPWHTLVDDQHLALLRARTVRVLTQGHLAQHVFFHLFHSLGSRPVAHELFGMSSAALDRVRRRGRTPLEVATRHGVPEHELTDGLLELLRTQHQEGIRTLQAWPAQSDRILARQTQTLACWLRSLPPSMDPGGLYGKATWQHGQHGRGWPSTPRQRRINERRVERVRRKLRWTCWPRVPAWSWPVR